jgi:hypothetical protein
VICNKSASLKVVTHNNHTTSNNYTEDCIKLIQNQALSSFFFFLCINDVDQVPAFIFPFSLSSIITVNSYLQVFSCNGNFDQVA